MTALTKTAPSLGALAHAVRKFRRATGLPIYGAVVCGLLACPSTLPAAPRAAAKGTTSGIAHQDGDQSSENHVAPAVGNGTISGTVLDEASHAVPQAKVYALITGVALGYVAPTAFTDANGHFVFRRLPWGTYQVGAGKPGAGYPSPYMFRSFYRRRRVPWVTVSAQAPSAAVVVRIGPKAGILTGSVVSARTGEPMTRASIDLKLERRPGAEIGEDLPARFRLLIPSEMAITLTVQARGFEPWRETVKMAPGERKVLTIRLRPLARRPGTPSDKMPAGTVIKP